MRPVRILALSMLLMVAHWQSAPEEAAQTNGEKPEVCILTSLHLKYGFSRCASPMAPSGKVFERSKLRLTRIVRVPPGKVLPALVETSSAREDNKQFIWLVMVLKLVPGFPTFFL